MTVLKYTLTNFIKNIIYGEIIISKISISTYNQGKFYFAVAVEDGKIIKTILPKLSEKDAIDEISEGLESYILSEDYKSLAKSICNLYHGKTATFENESLNLNFNKFQKDVLLEVMKIPPGEVKTYKQISEAIDTKAYRAVGTTIGKNPLPLIIPCHRVIRSDFKVGGFYGGTEMKKEILENEGVQIIDGKIKI